MARGLRQCEALDRDRLILPVGRIHLLGGGRTRINSKDPGDDGGTRVAYTDGYKARMID